MSTEDIARRRQAWTAQLRAQGLRPMDAARLAQAAAAQEVTELEIRWAAQEPGLWYGPGSPGARQGRAGLAAQAEAEVAASRARFEPGQRELLAQARGNTLQPAPQTVQTPQPAASQHEPETEPEAGA